MTYYPISNTGDAEAMAYRAGAKLANMEFTYVDYTISGAGGGFYGIKPFDKLGKYINRFGDSFVNTLEDSKKRVFLMVKEVLEGRGPIYIDLRDLPEELFKHTKERWNTSGRLLQNGLNRETLTSEKHQYPYN